MYLEEAILRINEKLQLLKGKKDIIVWGAAENTVRMFQFTTLAQYLITDFVDNGKAGERFFGKSVKAPKEIIWSDVDAVVISSFYHEDSIEEELRTEYGFIGTIIKLNETRQEVPFYKYLSRKNMKVQEEFQPILDRNIMFKDIHKNKRLFILCCGPSIKEMDLTVLKNEITMAVHSFYLHKDIGIIRPNYYCSAQWSYSDELKESLGLKFAKEIKKYMKDSKYFFCVRDREMIKKSGVYDLEEVNYYDYGNIGESLYDEIDFCQGIMPVQSVPILCLQLALYMGFQEIYLLGTEHDAILTGQYTHFYNYDDSIISQSNGETDIQGNLDYPFESILRDTYVLWEQYKLMKKFAERQGVRIYNATPNGILDVFERVDFQSLWDKKNSK